MECGGKTLQRIVVDSLAASAASLCNFNEPPYQGMVNTPAFINRKLSYRLDGAETVIGHSELLNRPENLVVLGEAGMGKSRLLEELDGAGSKRLTARRLIASRDPRELVGHESLVLVDALDEAPAFAEGGVVDQILAQLEQCKVVRFILACRSEDWQAATSRAIITETYGNPPLELQLKPFDDEQIAEFLVVELGEARAQEVLETYRGRGLSEWLGNPQTLTMLADVAKEGELPETTSGLFAAFVDLALREANPAKRVGRRELSREGTLDTLGAAFAALILSGKSALARESAGFSAEDLRLSELADLPGFADWQSVAGNRLIVTYNAQSERLIYSHRRIGEWLGARWLAKHAGSSVVRDRLLASLSSDGVVPASLRGLFAWLASNPAFSLRTITTDPMAVIEYGDADILGEGDARALLAALEALSRTDPWFAGWGNFRAKALIRGMLQAETLSVVFDKSRPARLRILLAKQFKGESVDTRVTARFRRLAMDTSEFYAIRDEAAEVLIGNLSPAGMRAVVEELRSQGTHDSTRLAAGVILEAGFENFDDLQVVETIFATCGHTICAIPEEGEDSVAARVWRYRYDVPDDRLASILDLMAEYANALLPEHRSLESGDIITLADALIARQLRLAPVEPKRLFKWLVAFGGRDSYAENDEKSIAEYLLANDDTRRSIQYSWFSKAEDERDLFTLSYKLDRLKPALHPSDEDVASLLARLPSDHDLRFEFMRLTRHTEDEGVATRHAARRFFGSSEEYGRHFDQLLNPERPEWQIKQEKREANRRAEQETQWEAFRGGMAGEIDALEQGRFGVILQAANAYLGRYSDLRSIPTAHERLLALCGTELTPSVLKGFEAFLNKLPPYPDAGRVARDYGRSRAWNARYPLLAAIAERVARTGDIGTLTVDQLISAQLHIANHSASGDEWKATREAVWHTLIGQSDAFERYARLLIEPSLQRRSEHVSGLYELLHDGRLIHAKLLETLAYEWLLRFPRMHERPEAELLDVLLKAGMHAEVQQLVKRRSRMKSLNEERRHNWQAAGLISAFDTYAPKLAIIAEREPSVFWNIRARLGARSAHDQASEGIAVRLAAWLVRNFRHAHPVEERPNRVTMGDTNPWDATEAISRLIDRIGSDISNEAEDQLVALAQVDDGYRDRILAVTAELRRNRAEQSRALISVDALRGILADGPPQSLPDMQAKVLNLLDRVQAQITSSDTDIWAVFYEDDRRTPRDEEYCRDRIIDALRINENAIQFSPEKHLGDDREGDIACEYGKLHLPIEVKGQWHDDLWRAADGQLTKQQARDHRAEGYGILLVLWFGGAGKSLKGPPRGSGLRTPTGPHELEEALSGASEGVVEGRLKVKVLDLSRG